MSPKIEVGSIESRRPFLAPSADFSHDAAKITAQITGDEDFADLAIMGVLENTQAKLSALEVTARIIRQRLANPAEMTAVQFYNRSKKSYFKSDDKLHLEWSGLSQGAGAVLHALEITRQAIDLNKDSPAHVCGRITLEVAKDLLDQDPKGFALINHIISVQDELDRKHAIAEEKQLVSSPYTIGALLAGQVYQNIFTTIEQRMPTASHSPSV